MAGKTTTKKNNATSAANSKKLLRFRFMVTSKFIGMVAFFFVFIVTVYAMYEMHISRDYSSLPQLIISAFGFASVYAGFYLVMAKVEHVEEEKTRREAQLHTMKQKDVPAEEIEAQKQKILELEQQIGNILTQPQNPLM